MLKNRYLSNYLLYGLMAIFTVILTGRYAQASDQADHLQTLNGRKILVVMTNHYAYPTRKDKTGLWFTELTHFYDVVHAAGFQMDFVSPEGGEIPLDEQVVGSSQDKIHNQVAPLPKHWLNF